MTPADSPPASAPLASTPPTRAASQGPPRRLASGLTHDPQKLPPTIRGGGALGCERAQPGRFDYGFEKMLVLAHLIRDTGFVRTPDLGPLVLQIPDGSGGITSRRFADCSVAQLQRVLDAAMQGPPPPVPTPRKSLPIGVVVILVVIFVLVGRKLLESKDPAPPPAPVPAAVPLAVTVPEPAQDASEPLRQVIPAAVLSHRATRPPAPLEVPQPPVPAPTPLRPDFRPGDHREDEGPDLTPGQLERIQKKAKRPTTWE